MKWIKNSGGYVVKDYPYFNLIVEEWYDKHKIYGSYRTGWFNNLDEAKKACIKYTKEKLLKYQKENKLIFSHDTWPNNTGNGKYIKPYVKGIRYNWLTAGEIKTSSVSKDHAIRLPIEWSDDQVTKFAKKIQDRHINRFLKESVNL